MFQAWLAMGADNSTFQLEKGEAYLNYYCLTIRETNTIRVIHANKDVKNIIRKVIVVFKLISKHWAQAWIHRCSAHNSVNTYS